MAAMAAIFPSSCRRFLHATHCTRFLPSAACSAHKAPQFPIDPVLTDEDREKARQLEVLMDNLVDEHNNTDGTRAAISHDFETCFIRPIDLSRNFYKYRKPSRRRPGLGPGRDARYEDIFIQHGIDPRRECDNETLLSQYMSHFGRIQPRNVTGLSQRSQRLVGKAIKRAKMMGFLPFFSNTKKSHLSPTPLHASRVYNTTRRPEDYYDSLE